MFLDEYRVFSTEFANKTGMHISNVSMVKKELEESENFTDIIKLGQNTFINKSSPVLPEYIKKGLRDHTYTNVKCLLPVSYVTKEFMLKKKDLDGLIERTNEIVGYKTLEGIPFVEFKEDFVDKMVGKNIYIMNKEDLDECLVLKYIDGYVQLAKNRYFTWYTS